MIKKLIIDGWRASLPLVGRARVGRIPGGSGLALSAPTNRHDVPPTSAVRHLPHEGGGEGMA